MSKQSDLVNVGNIIDMKAGGGGVEIYGDDNPLRIIKDSSTASWCYQEFYNQGKAGGRSHYLGAASDSSFHIGNDTVGTFLRSDTAGRVTMPYQPSWFGTVGVSSLSGGICDTATAEASYGLTFSNSRITVPISGIYLITFTTICSPGAGRVDTRVLVNGAETVNALNNLSDSGASDYRQRTMVASLRMSANDYIQFSHNYPYATGGGFTPWQTASVTLLG